MPVRFTKNLLDEFAMHVYSSGTSEYALIRITLSLWADILVRAQQSSSAQILEQIQDVYTAVAYMKLSTSKRTARQNELLSEIEQVRGADITPAQVISTSPKKVRKFTPEELAFLS